MKDLILLIILFPSLVLAVDDATVQTIDSKTSNANVKADANSSCMQALEVEDIILHQKIAIVCSFRPSAHAVLPYIKLDSITIRTDIEVISFFNFLQRSLFGTNIF